MRKLAILTFLTLDGVMQGPSSPEEDPSDGFTRGGWAANYWPEVMEMVMKEAMAEPYEPLFGRKTYDLFAAHWPTVDDDNPVGYRLNSAKKYCVTTNANHELPWENSDLVTGDVPAEIAKLKQEDGPLLQIHGSGRLVRFLLKYELIDEFRLWTFPVVLGEGRRLFADGAVPSKLKLIKNAATKTGVVMGIYSSGR